MNAPLVGLSLELFLFRRPGLLENTFSVCVLVAAVSVALTLGCWFAWSSLAKAEYRKVKEQARYIRERLEGDA